MSSVDLSVIICTLNRSSLLKKCLDSLVKQQAGPFTYEVIVVDNGSSDDTKAVAESFRSLFTTATYVLEPQKGLARARDTGFKASKGRYIAYLDDDATTSPEWCETICSIFRSSEEQGNSKLASIGGPCEPVFETGRPEWFTPQIGTYYAAWGLGREQRFYPAPTHPIGANCAFPREILLENPWKIDLVMLEDAELFRRLYAKEYVALYIPKMRIQHFIPAERLKLDWLFERRYTDGVALAQTFLLQAHSLENVRIGVSSLLKFAGLAGLSIFGPVERRVFLRCKMMTHLGIVAGMLRRHDLTARPYLSEKWRPAK